MNWASCCLMPGHQLLLCPGVRIHVPGCEMGYMRTHYTAFLRAVNVGGTGKLSMGDLLHIAKGLELEHPQTVLQSGNLLFSTELPPTRVKDQLETALLATMGKACPVTLRTSAEVDRILNANPFPQGNPSQVLVYFLDSPVESIPHHPQMRLAGCELYVHFPEGQGKSKLKVPHSERATARNLNTLQRIVRLAFDRPGPS